MFRTVRSISCLSVAAILLAATASARTFDTLVPASGPSFAIAMVSDGFADHDAFVSAARTMAFKLMAAEFYSRYANAFSITAVFDPTTNNQSRFTFHEVVGGTCAIAWDQNVASTLIAAAVSPLNTNLVVVVGNNDISAYGCTTPDWLYLTSGSRFGGTVLPHELGHAMGGLFDEYVTEPTAYSGVVDRENCSTLPVPYWSTLTYPSGTMPPPGAAGCNRYATGIRRPYDNACRMRDDSQTPFFCTICEAFMCAAAADALHVDPETMCSLVPPRTPKPPTNLRIISAVYLQPTPPSPSLEDRAVRVVVQLTQGGGATARSATDAVGRVALRQQRVGDYVYAVMENGGIVATAVISGDPFEIRGYQGRATPHRAADAPTANVVVQIPRATQQTLQARNVSIVFYRLNPLAGGQRAITPDVLRTLVGAGQAQPVGMVSAVALKQVLK